MARSFPRTLKLKVRTESYRWLDAAAVEVNQVFNYCNEMAFATATRTRAEPRIGLLQRRGHRRQAKRLHRKVARQRQDACHKFSREMVDRYQNIYVGDVSSSKLARTQMAKSVHDAGWGMLRRMLQYKGEHAGRSVTIVDERDTSRVCSSCGAPVGPGGLRLLVVRTWQCALCGDWHDRDVNAARNMIGFGSRCWTSVRGNELTQKQPPVELDIFVSARDGRVIAGMSTGE